ncbi:MAG: hypothetical protein R3282_00350 [Rhodothermales bacterium]|nr:hypothetical protein [Rhodothermales bacterium]
MTYIEHVNRLLRERVADAGRLVIYGQNVSAGSCVSGLARGLRITTECTVINTPNSENSLVGMGFGMMLKGVSSIFVMKQQDFLLLALDQLVNTYNLLRTRPLDASFTILPVIVDSGYEGPQSCLNNFYDFCSISRIPGYTITNRDDAKSIIDRHLISPGVRIIGVSQRLFRSEVIASEGHVVSHDAGDIHQYAEGDDVTVVGFNFAFPQAYSIWQASRDIGMRGSLFSVNGVICTNWDPVLRDLQRSQRLVIVDDSKSVNRSSDRLEVVVRSTLPAAKVETVRREYNEGWYRPNSDQLEVDAQSLVRGL